MNFGSSLRNWRRMVNMSQEELGKQLNVSKQYISSIEKGQKTISPEKLGMLLQLGMPTITDEMDESDEYVDVAFYPEVFASCGGGAFVLSEEKNVKKIPRTLLPNISKSHRYSVSTARGDSMQPTIRNGDAIVVQHWEGEQICDNEIYIFCYEDSLYVKRLSSNINQITIKSDNPEYNPIVLKCDELEKIKIIGKVVGVFYTS